MADEVTTKKCRVTKDVGEAFTVVLLLAWNDVITNGGKMSVSQLESVMKVKAADWVQVVLDQYRHIPIKDVPAMVLLGQINSDSGCGLIRKAKEAIGYIVNVLNPHWKDPTSFASGTQHVDALLVVRKAAWEMNEEEKRKLQLKKGVIYNKAEYVSTWQAKEWLAFRYLGVAAGRYLPQHRRC